VSYGIVVTDAPADGPVTLAQAKAHLNVGHDDDDALITRLIDAACEQTQTETGRRWAAQTLTFSFTGFPCRDEAEHHWPSIMLPVEPVRSVASVKYYDGTGAQRTLAEGTDYLTWLGHSPPLVYPAPGVVWPVAQVGRRGSVEVECAVGYATVDAIPAAAKSAVLLLVGLWYENRGDAEESTKLGAPPAYLRLVRSLHTGFNS